MGNSNPKSDGRFLSNLYFRVLPAQIFLLMLTGINNIVDGLVGSNFLGPGAMSVIGLYSPFQLIWVAVGTILVVGSQVLCGRYMGAGDLNRTRGVFSLDITITLAVTTFGLLLSLFLPVPIARFLGASPEVIGDLSGFIIGRGIGLIPMVLGTQFVAFLTLEGQDKRNYIVTFTLLAVNVALDLFFVHVIKMGILGLGIATSLSQWIHMIIAGMFFLSKKASLKYSFKSIIWKEFLGMLRVGFPSAIVFFLTSIRSGLFNNMLAAYDPTMINVAAMSTYAITIMIFESVGKGVAASGRLLTSVCYGEEDGRSITSVMKTVFTKGLLITLCASVFTFMMADFTAGMFYADHASKVFKLSADALRLGAAVLILDTIAAIFSNYFQAIGRTAAFLAGYAIVALCGPIYAILFWKRIPKTLSEWVTIPAGFGAADDERLDASIHSLEEAMTISSEVQKFCEKRNVDEKKAYYSALALEELCLGIIKDRFEADKKKHTIEVRVLHKGENIFMSLKDDCRPYNPQERADFLNPKDNSPKSMSIRLFMGIVKETEYQLTLGINVFTVTV